MMRYIEKPLLNCHYFLKPEVKLNSSHQQQYTITPAIVNDILYGKKTIYYTPGNQLLLEIRHEDEWVGVFKKVITYVLLCEYDILQIEKENWFENCWNKTFVVFNPVYEYAGKNYIFSNKYARATEINLDLPITNQFIAAGAYSIGNGMVLALSLNTLGKVREKDLFRWIDSIEPKNYFYHETPSQLIEYFLNNSSQIIDNLFKYAFVNNSERVYRYMYYLTNEDMFIYHNVSNTYTLIPPPNTNRYVTSITSFATRNDQIKFAASFRRHYRHGISSILPDLFHHLKMKNFKLISYIIDTSRVNFNNVLFVISIIFRKQKKFRKHISKLWRYFIVNYCDTWLDKVYTYMTTITKYTLPVKLIRDTIYRIPTFSYDAKWKSIFTQYGYHRIIERKIILRLKLLRLITESYIGGHTVEFIMKDFYQNHPELLYNR